MKFSRAPWLVPLALGLWPGACSPAPAEVPDGYDPSTAARSGSGTAGTQSTAGTGSSAGGTPSTTGGTGSSAGNTSSGGTGGGSVAGSANNGGTTSVVCGQGKGAATDLVIDDLEDGDNTIGNGANDPNPPVRVGYWFT